MSKRKGRRYELELLGMLEEFEWVQAKDVTHNSGVYADDECDILINFSEGRKLDEDLRMEVKYRKGATHFTHLYPAHLMSMGLGTQYGLEWDDGYCSGGLHAMLAYFDLISRGLTHQAQFNFKKSEVSGTSGECLTKQMRNWLEPDGMPPRDVLALRASAKKIGAAAWVFVWKRRH